jgi:hypothetical protein
VLQAQAIPVFKLRWRSRREENGTFDKWDATLVYTSTEITGTMAFDRKEFGMNSGIPFIKIADRVEVNVALKVKRVSGPPLVLSK